MTEIQVKKLDEIADRLGALYQKIGRLDLHPAVAQKMLDEVLMITQAVEAVSGRVQRAAAECH